MGDSVNLRHIITNRNKSIGIEFLEKLLKHTRSRRELQSNILYELTENYLKIEYFSKSIPSFIYKNPILANEEIITLYSSDLGDKDSLIIFNADWKGDFTYEKCYYEFDQIEIIGKCEEIKIFKQYLYRDNANFDLTDKWNKKTNGKLVLQTSNNELAFSSNYQNYKLIEDKEKYNSIVQNESCWISSIECEDKVLDQNLERILVEMFHHPEYYGKDMYSVEFKNQDQTIFKAKFDKKEDDWLFFQNGDLWKMMSNNRIKTKLKGIGYY